MFTVTFKAVALTALCISFQVYSMNPQPPAQQAAYTHSSAAPAALATASTASAGAHGSQRASLFVTNALQMLNLGPAALKNPKEKQAAPAEKAALRAPDQLKLKDFQERFNQIPLETSAARRHLYHLKLDIFRATKAPAVTPAQVAYQQQLTKLLTTVNLNYKAIELAAKEAALENQRPLSPLGSPRGKQALAVLDFEQTHPAPSSQGVTATHVVKPLLIAADDSYLTELRHARSDLVAQLALRAREMMPHSPEHQKLLHQKNVVLGTARARPVVATLTRPDTLRSHQFRASRRSIIRLPQPSVQAGAPATSSSSTTSTPASTLQTSAERIAPHATMLSGRSHQRAAERAARAAVTAAAAKTSVSSTSSTTAATPSSSTSSAAAAAATSGGSQQPQSIFKLSLLDFLASVHSNRPSHNRHTPARPAAATISSTPPATPGATH